MTLLHFDGFDNYGSATDLGAEYAVSNTPGVQAGNGRYGGNAVILTTGNPASYRKGLGAGYTDVWMGCAVKDAVGGGNVGLFSLLGSTGQFEVGCDFNAATGVFTVGRCQGSSFGKIETVLGTSAAQTGVANWNWVEFHATFSSSAGVLEVWFNGLQIINVTGQNTNRTGATGGYFEAWLGGRNAFDSGNNARLGDDFYVATTRLGDCKVLTVAPNSDATPNVGTPSTAGAHYLMVNETVPNLTNYVSLDASSAGNKELFGITSISTTQSILGVRANAFASKSDAADAIFAAVLKSGTTEVAGSTIGAVIGGNAKSTVLAELDPNTGAAWTQTSVNALNVGAKTLVP